MPEVIYTPIICDIYACHNKAKVFILNKHYNFCFFHYCTKCFERNKSLFSNNYDSYKIFTEKEYIRWKKITILQ